MINEFFKITDVFSFIIRGYILLVTIIAGIWSTKKMCRLWRTRHLRKIWGIKNGDHIIIVCSELDEPEKRQNVEPREFIYNLKYGDVDAYFEGLITLLRLFPEIKLRAISSGEAEKTRIDLARHLILIGGPDYNAITARFLKKGITQFQYKSPYVEETSQSAPDEIVLYDTVTEKEYYENTDDKDYGYFERIQNPNNPENRIIFIGGCHTIGVTGAVKAFSMADSEHGEIPKIVLANARKVAKKISKNSEFSVLVSVEKIGQTITVPIIEVSNVTVMQQK